MIEFIILVHGHQTFSDEIFLKVLIKDSVFYEKTEILAEALLDVQLLTRLNYLKMSKKLS